MIDRFLDTSLLGYTRLGFVYRIEAPPRERMEGRTVVVTGATVDALEGQITARKATLPAGTPFVQVTRELPFVFNVTRFSQVLTAYYFLFFLVILPVLGLRETPNRVPETIAKAIAAKHGAKPQEA